MRHHRTTRFATRSWRDLWQSNLTDLQSLQSVASRTDPPTIFIALDAEPWRDSNDEFGQIGLTFFAPNGGSSLLHPPCSSEQLRKSCSIYTIRYDIIGRQRSEKRLRRTRYYNGPVKLVVHDDIESTIVQALDTIPATLLHKHKHSQLQPTLCFVGFDVAFEFRVLSKSYPRILQQYSSWVDVQELVKDLSGQNESPSMTTVLRSIGYFDNDGTINGSRYRSHDAANDSEHIAAILINLLRYDPALTLKLIPDKSSKVLAKLSKSDRDRAGSSKCVRGRPQPYTAFPFAALVESHNHIPLKQIALYNIFSAFNPTAVGSIERRKLVSEQGVERYEKQKFSCRGWVCLASLGELEQFVAQLNDGWQSEIVDGTWKATSRFDPSLTTARTDAELKALQEAELNTVKVQAQILREQKKDEALREREEDILSEIQLWG